MSKSPQTYQCSQNSVYFEKATSLQNLPQTFLKTWFSLLETQIILSHDKTLMNIAWWDENIRILQTTTNWVLKRKHWVFSFKKQAFFYIHLLKGFWDTIYFSRKIKTAIRKNSKRYSQEHLHVQVHMQS